jgi:putative Mn2+ efflux pump MntP
MSLLEIMIIAAGLSMDTFALSLSLGLSVKNPKVQEIIIPAAFFGFFQGLMPVLGYAAGFFFADKIQTFDHWIAFVLLALTGGKMIKESLSQKEPQAGKNSFKLLTLFVLALATSIDALAIGITFAFFNVPILKAALIIGLITFFISASGVKLGNIFGIKLKSKAEFAGGAVLVLLGIKIVVEHSLTH